MDQNTLNHLPINDDAQMHKEADRSSLERFRLTHCDIADSYNSQGEMALLKGDLTRSSGVF